MQINTTGPEECSLLLGNVIKYDAAAKMLDGRTYSSWCDQKSDRELAYLRIYFLSTSSFRPEEISNRGAYSISIHYIAIPTYVPPVPGRRDLRATAQAKIKEDLNLGDTDAMTDDLPE